MSFTRALNLQPSSKMMSLREAAKRGRGRTEKEQSCQSKNCSFDCSCKRERLESSTKCHPTNTRKSQVRSLLECSEAVMDFVHQISTQDLQDLLENLADSELPKSLRALQIQRNDPASSLVNETFAEKSVDALIDFLMHSEQNSLHSYLPSTGNLFTFLNKKMDISMVAASIIMLAFKTGDNRLMELLETLQHALRFLEDIASTPTIVPSVKVALADITASEADLHTLSGTQWLNDKVCTTLPSRLA